jgi:hypothetical protein
MHNLLLCKHSENLKEQCLKEQCILGSTQKAHDLEKNGDEEVKHTVNIHYA